MRPASGRCNDLKRAAIENRGPLGNSIPFEPLRLCLTGALDTSEFSRYGSQNSYVKIDFHLGTFDAR